MFMEEKSIFLLATFEVGITSQVRNADAQGARAVETKDSLKFAD